MDFKNLALNEKLITIVTDYGLRILGAIAIWFIGNWVIKPQFEDAKSFSEGVAGVMINGLYGYIDKNGEFFRKPQFSNVYEFREGF